MVTYKNRFPPRFEILVVCHEGEQQTTSAEKRNWRRDAGVPLVAAVQAEVTNHPLLLPLREVVVSEMGKGSARHCQIRPVESNESERLMKCRKFQEVVKIGVYPVLREACGRNLFTAQMATDIKAARTF